MKFAKGLLSEEVEPEAVAKPLGRKMHLRPPVAAPAPEVNRRPEPAPVLKEDHLFETQAKTIRSSRSYLTVIGIVAIVVLIFGGLFFYLTLPGVGDKVRGPEGAEVAVRSHFSDVEKRTATDITFYLCDKFYWAHVDVEVRPDVSANPLARISSYSAKAVRGDDGKWNISAAPITSPDMDTPCK
jgi:hypothetical protein